MAGVAVDIGIARTGCAGQGQRKDPSPLGHVHSLAVSSLMGAANGLNTLRTRRLGDAFSAYHASNRALPALVGKESLLPTNRPPHASA